VPPADLDRRAFLTALAATAAACTARRPSPTGDDIDGNPVAPSHPFDVAEAVSEATARPFGLRHDEKATFRDGFSIYEDIVELKNDPDRKAKLDALDAQARDEVKECIPRLAKICAGETIDRLGYRSVRRLPREGRYVIFSDHHFTYRGHRTNFFRQSGNLQLYADALGQYDDAGFTVIEDGDVEDLVIFDPAFELGEVGQRMGMSLEELEARRKVVRLAQLERIVGDPDNAPYIAAAAKLAADGRLIRVAGNHDYDEQDDDFYAVLQTTYPGVERPSDVLLIGDQPDFIIIHGHQLDPATEPTSAKQFGETISECLGLYFQGPDRTWRWRYDRVSEWALGTAPYWNNLARGTKSLAATVGDDIFGKWAASKFDRDGDHSTSTFTKLVDDSEAALFEALFKHVIAWEYFVSDNPAEAVVDEVFTGDRWFKYRLLDEQTIAKWLVDTFTDDATRPTLICGHSHEARFHAADGEGLPFRWYMNTASAGRFVNLMWAIEIVDGTATLVSWSRSTPPLGSADRRTWRTWSDDKGGWMQASAEPEPVTQ
jgi:predicted phosphodiesterase